LLLTLQELSASALNQLHHMTSADEFFFIWDLSLLTVAVVVDAGTRPVKAMISPSAEVLSSYT
jgi:hypothetical protein